MKTVLFPFCCQWASLSGTVWYGTLHRSLLSRYQMRKSLLSISIALGVHDRQTCAEFAPSFVLCGFSGQRVTMVVRSSQRWQQTQQQGRPEEANKMSKSGARFRNTGPWENFPLPLLSVVTCS
jgi:hypothetical protein